MSRTIDAPVTRDGNWLTWYYSTRAAFSLVWVAAAFSLGREPTLLGAILLAIYPAWDALANVYDVRRHGGLKVNPTQAFNALASTIVTIAVIATLQLAIHSVLAAFGIWAVLAGLMQLATGVRRWRSISGQWPMILSGAQSTYAGTHFLHRAAEGVLPTSAGIAPYAAFGALYFAISAASLAWSSHRRRRLATAI